MRKLLILILSLSVFSNSYSQSDLGFAPLGAKWHYNTHYSGVNDHTIYTVTKDTLIDGLNCSEITITGNTTIQNGRFPNPYYVHYDSNRVYWQNIETGDFELLFDFNAIAGDSWEVLVLCDSSNNTPFDTMTFYVNSIYYDTINGQELKFLNTTFSPNITNGSNNFILAEYLGGVSLPYPADLICGGIIDIWFGDLRCYEDSTIMGYIWDAPCDNFEHVNIEDPIESIDITISPNPANQKLSIESDIMLEEILVKSLSGKRLINKNVHSKKMTLDTSSLREGFYLVSSISKNGSRITQKVIIQH